MGILFSGIWTKEAIHVRRDNSSVTSATNDNSSTKHVGLTPYVVRTFEKER